MARKHKKTTRRPAKKSSRVKKTPSKKSVRFKKRDSAPTRIVRGFLNALSDEPKDKKRPDTIQCVEREYGIPVADLRRFREGDDSAIAPMLTKQWARALGSDGSITVGRLSPIDRDWYNDVLEHENHRVGRFDHYETIDDTRPEAAQALDAWADIVVTGSMGETTRWSGGFEPTYIGRDNTTAAKAKSVLKQANGRINRSVLPEDQKLMLVRDICKYGEDFAQIGLERNTLQQRWEISRLVSMPVRTMWINTDVAGMIDLSKAYVQKKAFTGAVIGGPWPAWKMVHFRNQRSRQNPYGTSIFHSNLRTWIQMESLEAGLIIRRLERAPMRYKHTLDVGHLSSSEQIEAAKKEAMEKNTRVPTVDNDGKFRRQRIATPVEKDWYVAKRDKESPANVEILEGDGSIGEITDFLHFWRKWLSGLGPPAPHLGYVDEVMRSVLTDLHIVWARKGRRMQLKFIQGLHHMFQLELLLNGIDPRRVPYVIYPPSLGTRDELIRAQVQLAYSNTVKNLAAAFATTGRAPTPEWWFKYILGLDDDAIDELELRPIVATVKGKGINNTGQNPNPRESEEFAQAASIAADPGLHNDIEQIKMLIQERAIERRKDRYLNAENAALIKTPDIFGCEFDSTVRLLCEARALELDGDLIVPD